MGAGGQSVPDPGTWTILVAEDDSAVRAYFGKVLERQEYHVLKAVDGVNALEVAAEYGGPIHLLLTDLAMPRLDGRELDRALHLQHPEMNTVFVSGYCVAEFLPAGAFLPKPIVARELLRRVREALQRRTPHEQLPSQNRSRVAAE